MSARAAVGMITRIESQNYRCFSSLSIDLGRYHVLAGANGAGKTTLLDVIPLLGDLLTRRRIAEAFLQRSESRRPPRAVTLGELVHRGCGEVFGFAIEAELPDEVTAVYVDSSPTTPTQPTPTHLRYELRLEASNRGLEVADEYLFLFSRDGSQPRSGKIPQGRPEAGGRLVHPEWQPVISREGRGTTRIMAETGSLQLADALSPHLPQLRVPPTQLALGAVPPDPGLFPAALWWHQLLTEGAIFFDPNWDLLRRPAPPGDPDDRLLPSGRNTPWLALALQATDPERFSSWIDHVRTALPQVAEIQAVEREEDRYAYFRVRYSGGHEVTSSGLSDGTLRILAMSLLPYLPDRAVPRLLVTEEPENGIHPQAIETVVQSLSSLYASQVWVSTHSPIVLANTDLADVLAARLDCDGAVSVIPGNQHPRLVDWHGTIDIGSLFAAGVFS